MFKSLPAAVHWPLGFLLTLTVAAGEAAEEASPQFRAGAAAVSITPPTLPVESAGSMTPRTIETVHDDLYARCLVLDDGSTQLALVLCDSCMIARELFDQAKQEASRRTGIPTGRILCSATHTHSAVCATPVFQSRAEPEYNEFLAGRIAEAITEAYQRLQPARIGWAVGNAPQHVFNRRWFMRPGVINSNPFELGTDQVRMNPPANHRELLRPAGPVDPEVAVLAVQSLAEQPIAVWANYSLHYVGGVPGNALSADYFGEFARQVEQRLAGEAGSMTPVVAMTNGTSGDINNINFYEGGGRQQPFEQIRLVAHELATAALNAYQRIEFYDWVPLKMREQEMELAVRRPSATEIEQARQWLAEAGPGPWSDRRLIYANETLHLADFPATVAVKLQALRIGDLGIASSPCETFVETGLAIKRLSPLRPTFVIELANGYNGYLPTREQHALGGYETWRAKSSYLAEEAESRIREVLLQLLTEVAQDARPADELSIHNSAGQSVPHWPADALSLIESTRGGRHWVDEPTDPPKSPAESLACLQIEPGLKVELVAAEPLVFDPVWIAFDQQGRLFVAEYGDYPEGPARPGSPPLSRVVCLEDTNGDGQLDHRQVFADQLDFAHSLMPYREGLLVGTQDQILYLRDSTGDGRADVREVLFAGFQSPHPQMQIGCPQWGIDNWVYFNYGSGEVRRHTDRLAALFGGPLDSPAAESSLTIRSKDFRFHAVDFRYEQTSGFGQFGNTVDRWGRRFFCTNRNPIMFAPIPSQYLLRNTAVPLTKDQYDVAPAGEQAVIYPLVEMKSNYLSHAGTYTAACGTTAYLGGLLDRGYDDNLFVCEPIGHLVARYHLRTTGATLCADRVGQEREFLASSDRWFRPVSLASGPDGALYLADMYRLWVEHPKFLPADVADRLDWRAGEDRGRIWRIVPADWDGPLPSFVPAHDTQQLLTMLADENGWRQQLAHRLLVERQATALAPALRQLLREDRLASVCQRALWVLDGVGELSAEDIIAALGSAHAVVRGDAARLAAGWISENAVLAGLLRAAGDEDASVRFQCALALGESDAAEVTEGLIRIALHDALDDWTVTAILSSARNRSGLLLNALVSALPEPAASYAPQPAVLRLVRELAASAGARDSVEALRLMADLCAPADEALAWWHLLALSGLAEGLSRTSGSGGSGGLERLLNSPPVELPDAVKSVKQVLSQAVARASDRQATSAERLAAIELLGYRPVAGSSEMLEHLAGDHQPVIRSAALLALQRADPDRAAAWIVGYWSSLGPRVRGQALSFMLSRKSTTYQTLQAMVDGGIDRAIVSIDQRALLLAHPDRTVQELARQVFGSGITQDRQQAVNAYQPVLAMQGSEQAGRQVYERNCAACHRLRGQGHEVGPDLSDTRNRSKAALLLDILDPNQKLEPHFIAYQALTEDGSLYQGLLLSETGEFVVLKMADGKEQTVARQDLAELRSSGKSLMPEGIESAVSLEQMADLLEFLKPSQ